MSKDEEKMSIEQTSDNSLSEVKRETGVVRKKLYEMRERHEDFLERNDPIYLEPLTPKKEVEEGTEPLCRGGVDKWFLLFSMMLLCFGIVMCYSAGVVEATVEYDNPTYYLVRNLLFTGLAIIITAPFVILARPNFWRLFGVGAYLGAIGLLMLVLLIGTVGGGAQRWIAIGPVTIQPSEIAKTGVVMLLALYMSKYEKQITSYGKFTGCFKHGFFAPMTIIGILGVLIALEGHISGLMIIAILGVTVMFVGGSRPKYLLIMFAIIAVAFLLLVAVSSYAQSRIEMWWHPENDPQGKGWQTLQGLYAIGSGGFFGLGLGFSRQKFGYVSQPQNDFIFTIICEELGFMGALLVILLFALLIWRGIKIGQHAPDKFSALVVWGLTFKIAIQVLLNIAVVTNTIPNTGITLPFFSAGGTSQIIQLFELGIILSISRFSTQKK